ncbi:MAG: PadR family transcriptional regulator [Rhodothermales bacterium]
MLTKALAGAASKPIMLSVLSEGESYGYAIIQRIHDLSGGAIAWADGTLYPVLHRMEDEGLIASTWRTSEAGRRRKYYRITTRGRQALETEKQQWLRVDAVLAQLWGLQPRLAG